MAVENPEMLNFNDLFEGDDHYILKVRGQSMIEDHIEDGDFVVVRKQSSAANGERVVAMVDNEVTLKRFHSDKGQVRLDPANGTMQPIFVDPSSDARFSERQERYGVRVYTPQAVVDGRRDLLGSDERAIVTAVTAAAREPHGTVQLTPATKGVRIAVTGLSHHSDADVMVAVVEDNLVSKVERGENAGRTLVHVAVVRALERVGTVRSGAAQWSAEVPVPSSDSWKEPRLVVFVQDAASGRVLAAGALQKEGDGGAAKRDQRGADDQAHGAKKAHAP